MFEGMNLVWQQSFELTLINMGKWIINYTYLNISTVQLHNSTQG